MVAEALQHQQAMLAYQSVVVGDGSGRVGFYEGLIRVIDETGRIIPAKDFMPVVEKTELGREIDVTALNLGLSTLYHHRDLRLSINMSARSIGFSRWNRTLNRWLEKDSALGHRLILEITESSAMDQPDVVVDFMDRLSRRGICFALDDFGAGHTALRYFKDFFFDVLKIDGQFCRGIAQDPDNEALVKAMIEIGRHFDMLIVAEGIESHEDAVKLGALGVDCMQGFFFDAPTIRPVWQQTKSDGKRRGSSAA